MIRGKGGASGSSAAAASGVTSGSHSKLRQIVPAMLRAASLTNSSLRLPSNVGPLRDESQRSASIASSMHAFVFRAVNERSLTAALEGFAAETAAPKKSAGINGNGGGGGNLSLQEEMRKYNRGAFASSDPRRLGAAAATNASSMLHKLLTPHSVPGVEMEMCYGIAARNLGNALGQRRFRATLAPTTSSGSNSSGNIISVCSHAAVRRPRKSKGSDASIPPDAKVIEFGPRSSDGELSASLELDFTVRGIHTAALLTAIEKSLAALFGGDGAREAAAASAAAKWDVEFERCSNWAVDPAVVSILSLRVRVFASPSSSGADDGSLATDVSNLLNNGIFETRLREELPPNATVSLMMPAGRFVVGAKATTANAPASPPQQPQQRRLHFLRLGGVTDNAPTALHRVENLFTNGFANFFSPRRFGTMATLHMAHVHALLRTGDFREALVALVLIKMQQQQHHRAASGSTALPADWIAELDGLFRRDASRGRQDDFLALFTQLPVARQMEVLTAIPAFEWNCAASRALGIMHGHDRREDPDGSAFGADDEPDQRFDLREASSRRTLRDADRETAAAAASPDALLVHSVARLYGEKWELVGNAAGRHIFLHSPVFDEPFAAAAMKAAGGRSQQQMLADVGSKWYDTALMQRVMTTEVAASRPWPATDAAFYRKLAPELRQLFGMWGGALDAATAASTKSARIPPPLSPLAASRPLLVLPSNSHVLVLSCETEILGSDDDDDGDGGDSHAKATAAGVASPLESTWVQYLRHPAADDALLSPVKKQQQQQQPLPQRNHREAPMLKPRQTRTLTTRHGLRSLGIKFDAPAESYLWSALREVVRLG